MSFNMLMAIKSLIGPVSKSSHRPFLLSALSLDKYSFYSSTLFCICVCDIIFFLPSSGIMCKRTVEFSVKEQKTETNNTYG